MKKTIRQLDPAIVIENIEFVDDHYQVHCHLRGHSASCPFCGTKSRSVHSIHSRKIQDLPSQGKPVYIIIDVRHFKCPICKKIFTEQLSFAPKTAHKTDRLVSLILDSSCTTSSITSQALLKKQGVMVRKSSICSYQKKRRAKQTATPSESSE